MFPPKKTKDPSVAVSGLLQSLQRAGLEVADCMQSDGKWCVRLFSMPPEIGVAPMKKYIRSYLKACGWKASATCSKCRLWISVEEANSSRKTG